MGILAALKLNAPASGPSADAKQARAAIAAYDKTWKEALGFAAGLKDVPTKLALAQALKACDAKRKEANGASADPAMQLRLLTEASAAIAAARESAYSRSEGGARTQAQALRGTIEKAYKGSVDAHAKMEAEQEALKTELGVAKGAAKVDLAAKAAALDKQMAAAEHRRDQAQKDVEALANPLTKREEFVAILARQKSGANVVSHIEIDSHTAEGGKPGEKHVTTTKTSYVDGEASVDKTDVKRTIGLDGVTQTVSREKEATTAEGTLRRSAETRLKVGPGGVSRDSSDKTELGHPDGTRLTVENASGTEVGKDGVKQTSSRTVTRGDGSSTATTSSTALQRGDGKLGVGAEATTRTADAAGSATTKTGSASGGITAADGAMGGYGDAKTGIAKQGPGGIKAGLVAGLSASAKCVIGDPKGDPPRWPVTTTVRSGVSVSASGGHAKKGAQSSGSVEITASKEIVFEQTHQMFASELAGYLKALTAADRGGMIDKTWKEVELLGTGVSQGWDSARKMLGGKTDLASAVGQRAGESASVGIDTAAGGKVAVNVRAVKIGVSVDEKDARSLKATRTDKGGIDAESNLGHTSARSGSVGVAMGVVEGGVGRSHSLATSLGYMITIDAGQDPAGKLLAAFQACNTGEQQQAFIDAHKGAVKLTGKKTGSSEKSGETASLKIGVELKIGSSHGTDESRETDGEGKLRKSTVKGSNKAGGSIGVGPVAIGDSGSTDASSEQDDQGNVELNLARTQAQTNYRKLARKLIGRDTETGEKKKGGGLIAAAAGKEADPEADEAETQDHDISGIRVTNADLKKIVAVARGNMSRWTACAVRRQDYFDWQAAGVKIAAGKGDPGTVSDELARFVGGGSSSRLDVLEQLIRPRGDVSMATRADFPESLKKLRAPYQKLVVAESESEIAQVARKDGTAAGGKRGQEIFEQLGGLLTQITASKDFTHPAVQAEMMSAINERKTAVLKAMKKNAGQVANAEEDAKAEHDEYARLLKECVSYETLQEPPLARIRDMLDGRRSILVNRDFAEASKLVRQLDDLYAIWMRDWAKAEAIGKKIGKPESHYGPFKPKLEGYPKLKKACFM